MKRSSRAHRHDHEWALLKIAAYVVPREDLVVAACAVAKTVLHLVTPGDSRPVRAIEIAIEWTLGRASRAGVGAAADAAWGAWIAYHHVDIVAARAARACAYAAYVAYVALVSASAANAANAAGAAAAVAEDVGSNREDVDRDLANIVRASLAHRDILADLVNANRDAR